MAALPKNTATWGLEELLRSCMDLDGGVYSFNTTGVGGGGQTVSVNAGAVDATTTRVVVEDLLRAPWLNSLNLNVNGGSTTIVYFTGVEGRNPSGSTENIDTATVDDGTNSRTMTFTYDAADQITLVATT